MFVYYALQCEKQFIKVERWVWCLRWRDQLSDWTQNGHGHGHGYGYVSPSSLLPPPSSLALCECLYLFLEFPGKEKRREENMASSLRRTLLRLQSLSTIASVRNQTSSSSIAALSPLRTETPYYYYYYYYYRSHLGSIARFSSYEQSSFDIDLSNEETKRRIFNRLLYRSKQRGYLELDLVLGKWVEEHIFTMDESRIKALVTVLDLENPDLWKWLSSQEEPPEELNSNSVFCDVRDKVLSNLNNHSSPETRATPGEPWVRGWDDLKRGRDSPVTGNQ